MRQNARNRGRCLCCSRGDDLTVQTLLAKAEREGGLEAIAKAPARYTAGLNR